MKIALFFGANAFKKMSKTSLGVGGSKTASDWRQTTITRQLEILGPVYMEVRDPRLVR